MDYNTSLPSVVVNDLSDADDDIIESDLEFLVSLVSESIADALALLTDESMSEPVSDKLANTSMIDR